MDSKSHEIADLLDDVAVTILELKTSRAKKDRAIYSKYEHMLQKAYELLNESIQHPSAHDQLRMVVEASMILVAVRDELDSMI